MLRPNKRMSAVLRRVVPAVGRLAPRPAAAARTTTPATVFRSDTPLVVLHATVVDKNGHLVTNLRKEAFQVFENGSAAADQDVQARGRPGVDGPDRRQQRQHARQARQGGRRPALALVKASNPQDEVFVVNFNDEAFLDTQGKDFTNDIKEMEEALTRIDSRGGTAMRDAIRMSIDHVKEKAHKDKKVLVVVTDGNDNASVISLEKLVKAAQQSEVLVYPIGLLTEEERREAKRAQRALECAGTGHRRRGLLPQGRRRRGPHRAAGGARRPQPVHHRVHARPTRRSTASFRQIKVVDNAPGKPTVRTRSGYYATPRTGKVSRTPCGSVEWNATILWRLTRGYRLRPWRSPYLRWRIETYWGMPAETIGFGEFWKFTWDRRRDLFRYLKWAQRSRCAWLRRNH